MKIAGEVKLVMRVLRQWGLLLESDARLPNVASLVADRSIRGSWWGDPRAHEIFCVLNALADHKDVTFTKLIAGRVTLVHRQLWRELLAIATAREGWQIRGLTSPAQFILQLVDKQGELRSDRISWPSRFHAIKVGDAVRELERRLLIHAEQFHSERGAHVKLLESWDHWARRIKLKGRLLSASKAMGLLESRVAALNKQYAAAAHLPWSKPS